MAEETHQASRSAARRHDLGRRHLGHRSGSSCSRRSRSRSRTRRPCRSSSRYIATYIWKESMSTTLGRVPALHRRRGAALLPHGMHHVGLADAVRVLARPSCSRPPDCGGASRAIACPSGPCVAVAGAGFLLMVPTYWNNLAGYYVGTSVGTTGLYIAFILPVILRLQKGIELRARRLEPREPLQVDQPDRDHLGRRSSRSCSCSRPARRQSRGTTASTGTPLNYAPLTIGGAFILFGGWWVLSAKNWFVGPVRMGTDEELEQLEAKQESDVPAAGRHAVRDLARACDVRESTSRGAPRRRPSRVRGRYPTQAPPF